MRHSLCFLLGAVAFLHLAAPAQRVNAQGAGKTKLTRPGDPIQYRAQHVPVATD